MPNYDSFDDQTALGGSSYTVGSSLGGQTNAPNYRWNNTGSSFGPSKPVISGDNLTYPGLPSGSGGSVAFTPSANADPTRGGGARLDLHYSGGGTVYYSFLLKITDLANVQTWNTNNPIAAFCDDPGEQTSAVGRLGTRLLTRKAGSGYVLGTGRNNTPGEYLYETNTVHLLNEVVFVVGSYELVGGVTNVNLWVNPDASTFGTDTPPPPAVSVDTFSSNAGNLNSSGPRAMAILCQFGNAPSGIIDDLRVGNAWSIVTGALGFSGQPTDQSAVVGSNVTFTAVAVGRTPITYKWQKDGVEITNSAPYYGVTSATLVISNVTHAQEGYYSVVATSDTNSVTSTSAYLTVTDPVTDPRIITPPASSTNVAGSTASFHVVAAGTAPLSYQWLTNGNIMLNDPRFAGIDTDTLSISNVTSADQVNYTVAVMNGIGTWVTSAPPALLTVLTPLSITAQPTSRTVPEGGKTALAVGVAGSGPFTYQWQFASTTVGTNAAYVISNVQASVAGNYRLIVTGPLNSQTSDWATVSIAASPRLYPTNVTALRIGDGAQSLTAHGNPIFVDQFTPGGALVNTLTIPDSGPNGMVAIGPNVVPSPSSITGSGLTKSANDRFLVFGAYNTNLSLTVDLFTTSATAVPRGIGVVDSEGRYALLVSATNAFGNTFWRGALYDGTNNFWGWGRAPGTYYFGFDAPAGLVEGEWPNIRSMGIFNGTIYGASAVMNTTTRPGVMRLPGGLTTVSNAIEMVIDSGRTSSSDCAVDPTSTVIYIADDNGAGNGGGVQKWQFDGSTWNLTYTLSDGLPSGARYLVVDFTTSPATIYAAGGETDNNPIVQIQDTGSTATGTVLARAGANQTFRGLRMGPSPAVAGAQPMLSIVPDTGKAILNWTGSYFLQSATDVTGPYSDLINATRPYTNSTGSASQQFFRLRQ